jgi:heme-degrading monooxygenase HmoA
VLVLPLSANGVATAESSAHLAVDGAPGRPTSGTDAGMTSPMGRDDDAVFVAFSELTVPMEGRGALEAAFADRLGEVDGWPGFRHLEVWEDRSDPCGYVMVSWWDSSEAFSTYMRSAEHRSSHARIPTGDDRPRPSRFRRYTVVAR